MKPSEALVSKLENVMALASQYGNFQPRFRGTREEADAAAVNETIRWTDDHGDLWTVRFILWFMADMRAAETLDIRVNGWSFRSGHDLAQEVRRLKAA